MKLSQLIDTYVKPNIEGGIQMLPTAMDFRKGLIKTINECRTILQSENSVPEGKLREFDFDQVRKDLELATEILIQLKSAIAVANAMTGAIECMFREDELNGILNFYEELTTHHGPTEIPTGKYTEEEKTVVFDSKLRKAAVAEIISDLETQKVVNKNKKDELSATRPVSLTTIVELLPSE